jgi:CubicO group peptidase (beta-lactamase class C family)
MSKWSFESSRYAISSGGHLGRLIEVISGESLEDFLQSEVFEPLQMTDTSFYLEKKEDLDRLVDCYHLGTYVCFLSMFRGVLHVSMRQDRYGYPLALRGEICFAICDLICPNIFSLCAALRSHVLTYSRTPSHPNPFPWSRKTPYITYIHTTQGQASSSRSAVANPSTGGSVGTQVSTHGHMILIMNKNKKRVWMQALLPMWQASTETEGAEVEARVEAVVATKGVVGVSLEWVSLKVEPSPTMITLRKIKTETLVQALIVVVVVVVVVQPAF